jgi:Ca2+-binding RTX toxin-like protein
MSLVDPDGGATPYSYSATSLTATTLAGGAAANFAGDLTVSSTGVVTASGVDTDRVYELTVQVTQGAATHTETFSVVVGTNAVNTVNGGYTSGDDVIYALGQNDIILAGSGNDTVFGQGADDQINGGDGNDVLTGAGGNDTFVFDTTLNAVTNVDRIQDFEANGNDKIHLDDDIFSAFSVAGNTTLAAGNFAANSGGNAAAGAAGTDDYILYDTATGNLYYDADGNGAGAKVLFATLTLAGVTGTVDNTDFIVIP